MFKLTEIETYDGMAVDVMNPDPKTITLLDISTALSRLCRFNGHTHKPYYVAQHCGEVANFMVQALGKYREVYLWGLLHDAAEAYIGDIPRPVKHQFQGVKEMEEGLMEAICKRFAVPYPCPWPLALKRCDNKALMVEAYHLMHSYGEGYNVKVDDQLDKLHCNPIILNQEQADTEYRRWFEYGDQLTTYDWSVNSQLV